MKAFPEILTTADGSLTLRSDSSGDTYHSTHGAQTESQYVFIEMGLKAWQKENPSHTSLEVFEVGFGTGLNALLAFRYQRDAKIDVHYLGLEPFPLDEEVFWHVHKNLSEHDSDFLKRTLIFQKFSISDFYFDILKVKLEDFDPVESTLKDVIFFDAFAPNHQPEIWCRENFEKLYSVLNPKGLLVTYCAKGSVKRLLKDVGFMVVTCPGPPGKREMIQAWKLA